MAKQAVQFGNGVMSEQLPDLSECGSLRDKVIAVLRTVYDPEIPLNLYDLGLIYNIGVDEHNKVRIQMTLTTPHCPVAESMPGKVASAVQQLEEVTDVKVDLVWDPPWNQERMSDEAKLTLGLL